MMRVKYNDRYDQGGYEYRRFDSYEDFGKWYISWYKSIIIWDIERL